MNNLIPRREPKPKKKELEARKKIFMFVFFLDSNQFLFINL